MQIRWYWLATCLLSLSIVEAETPTTPTLQPIPASAQAAREQSAREERNKAAVIAFFNTMNAKDWNAARQYIGDHWIEHNAGAPDGLQGIEMYYKSLKERMPEHQTIIRGLFAQGDLVVAHTQDFMEPGSRSNSLIQFLRLENGKIVEHWDVHQEVPGVSNDNSMF